MTHSVF